MNPRKKRRKSCSIASAVEGLEGAEKGNCSGDVSEEGWETDLQCSAGGEYRRLMRDCSSLLSSLPFWLLFTGAAPATASPSISSATTSSCIMH